MTPRRPTPADRPRRAIRSFVVRAGRMTVAQDRAWQELWPRFGIETTDAAARPARDLRSRRAAHARDRVRQRRIAGRARRGAPGAGLPRHRGASPRRRPPDAARGGTAARQLARDLPRRRRGAAALHPRRIARRGAAVLPGSLAEEAPSQAAHRAAGVRRAGREPVATGRRVAHGDGLAALRRADARGGVGHARRCATSRRRGPTCRGPTAGR